MGSKEKPSIRIEAQERETFHFYDPTSKRTLSFRTFKTEGDVPGRASVLKSVLSEDSPWRPTDKDKLREMVREGYQQTNWRTLMPDSNSSNTKPL